MYIKARRQTLVWILFHLAYENGQTMNTPSTNVDDMAIRLGKGEEKLGRLSRLVNGWVRGVGTNPDFSFFGADRAEFVNPPLETLFVTSTTPQNIAANTWTDVLFQAIELNTGLLSYSTATGIFAHNRSATQQSYLIFGYAGWGTNSSGYRIIRISGSTGLTKDIAYTAAFTPNDLHQPFVYQHRATSSEANFSVQGWQNGAPNLNMSFSRLSAIRVANR